ncbi:DUF6308 family protein [Georgenia muralis]|uniref:Uncharacterized protein n=1 Tax=Georgenia muralis TaxID=154117 RepID=A0A3N4ZCH2_9MICO|nr:DUF6308 family protein [Georgenia muralis]RPF29010.1 hypothetical protein EDD32_3561 [Georgenia muralis]
MTIDAPWVKAPATWPAVSTVVIGHARRQALIALSDDGPIPVGERLAAYYDVDGDHVGATFATMPPNDWHDITGADVLSVILVHGAIGPRAARRLLSGPHRGWTLTAMRDLPGRELLTADPDTLVAMEDFHLAVESTLASPTDADPSRWGTANKLCARKRPDLFPASDRNICRYLGLRDVREEWQVFRALMQDDDVRQAIEALPAAARSVSGDRQLQLDDSDLRLLDAALWTYTVGARPRPSRTRRRALLAQPDLPMS